jgi:hypothetical protein
MRAVEHLPVQHPDTAARERAHRELRLGGEPQLPDDDGVERRVQLVGDGGRDGDPAAREPEHERFVERR